MSQNPTSLRACDPGSPVSSRCFQSWVWTGGLVAVLLGLPALTQAAQLPPAPTALTASNTVLTLTPATQRYILSWQDNSADEDGFEIKYKEGSGPLKLLQLLPSSDSVRRSTGEISLTLDLGITAPSVQFVVRAYRGTPSPVQFSASSNTVTLSVPSTASFNKPTNLVATAIGDGAVKLEFTDNATRESGFEVEVRKQGEMTWNAVGDFSFGSNPVVLDGPFEPTSTQEFRIRAFVDDMGRTYAGAPDEYSNIATVTLGTFNAPENFTATRVGETGVSFKFDDKSTGETGYEITYRAFGDFNFEPLVTVGANVSSVPTQTGLDPRTQYEFQVQAFHQPVGAMTPSQYSLAANVVLLTTEFNAPTGLTATPFSDTAVDLAWTDVSSVEQGYQVYYREGTSGPFLPGPSTAPDVESARVEGLTPGVLYSFRVVGTYQSAAPPGRSSFPVVESVPSNIATASTRDAITSKSYASIVFGQPFSFTVTTSTGSPRTSLNVSDLPAGLSLNSSTGVISGTPTEDGVHVCPVVATFSNGATATGELTLRVTRNPGAPVVAEAIPNRKVNVGTAVTIPLAGNFDDPDTDQAVRLNTNLGAIDIALYSSLAPDSVSNFLAYVSGGYYSNVAFHELLPGNFLRVGSYKVSTAPDNFNAVPDLGSVANEPGIPNVRGTVALAKNTTDPDSGTHDFFFNLSDNSNGNGSDFDNLNGGYAVFGRVSTLTLANMDAIGVLGRETYNINVDGNPVGPLFNWPMNTGSVPDTMNNTLVARINSAAVISPLTYAVLSNSNPSVVTASISGGTNVVIQGVANGTSNITIQVTDLDGQVVTDVFQVQVDSTYVHPGISSQPSSLTRSEGQSATFSVTATGTGLSFQWRKDGVDIPGANSSSYTINSVTLLDQGAYSVRISNLANTITSNNGNLTVNSKPLITVHPQSQTRNFGSSVTFSVTALSNTTPNYKWKKGGAEIPGANSSTFTIPVLDISDTGDYTVEVSNGFGASTSGVAHLTVAPTDADDDGLADNEEPTYGTSLSNPDTDNDGFSDGLEVALGTNPKSASSKPSTYFIASLHGEETLGAPVLRRISAGTLNDSLNGDTPTAVDAFWLGTTEVTNSQFASILQHAQDSLQVIDVEIPTSGPKTVRYQGQIVCMLPTHAKTDPNGLAEDEVDYEPRSKSFIVKNSVAGFPVRGVSWYGAYLAAVVMNDVHGYAGKATPASWQFDFNADGFQMPRDLGWEWVARSGAKNLTYPTGPTPPTASLANFGNPAGAPKSATSFKANTFGVFNLGGNVAEWVFEEEAGNSSNAYTRGGGFADAVTALESAARASVGKDTLSSSIGIRLALKDDRSPIINTPPASLLVYKGDPWSLSVDATGAVPLGYQWAKAGKSMSGKTKASLDVAAASVADASTYTVKVTNALGSVTTPVVSVGVVDATPVSLLFSQGFTFFLKAPAFGSDLSYQWQQDGVDLTDNADVIGAMAATLQIKARTTGASGVYTCVVTKAGVTEAKIGGAFNVTIQVAPVLHSVDPGLLNVSTYYQIFPAQSPSVNQAPTTYFATGLPPGLKLNGKTGEVSGYPTEPGTYVVTVFGSNAVGVSSAVSTTITVQGLPGTVVGPFVALTGADSAVNNGLGGRLDVTTTTKGTFTGKLNNGGLTYSFKGQLDATDISNPTGRAVIARKGTSSLQVDFTLHGGDTDTNLIEGSVGTVTPPSTVPTASVSLAGWRQTWHAKANLPTSYAGYHTTVSRLAPGDVNIPAIPQGAGYASITVSTAGMATVSGKTADGNSVTSSAPLGLGGEIVLFQALYKNTGSLTGMLNMTADAAHTLSGSLSWIKLAQSSAKTRDYKDGFGPLTLSVDGGLFVPVKSPAIILGLTASPGVPNAQLGFAQGGIGAPPPDVTFEVTDKNKVLMPKAGTVDNPNSVTLSFSTTKGTFAGKFKLIDPDPTKPGKNVTRSVSYQGMIVPTGPGTGEGVGYFLLPQLPDPGPPLTTLSTSPILSGHVVFEATP